MLGSILTVALALLVDWLASLAELLLRPRGLEVGLMRLTARYRRRPSRAGAPRRCSLAAGARAAAA